MSEKRRKQNKRPAENEKDSNEVNTASGMVIKNTGSNFSVIIDDGREIDCRIKGNFRLKGIRTTNPVAVGDKVDIVINADGTAAITAIHTRWNYIIRRASNLSKEASILAANIDQACLVVTLAHPATSTTFIDRFLATAEAYRVPATIIINKVDLICSDNATNQDEKTDVPDDSGCGEQELLEAITYLYESIGYPVIHVSAKNGKGMEKLRGILDGKVSLMSGNSGVGKSTIINSLIPGLGLKTAEISDIHDTGTHTTTFSEMFRLPDSNGWIIDTPGVRGFGTIEFDTHQVGHYFPEIFKFSARCRYNNCTHTHEPHCAVKEALDNSFISQSRYNSYLSILEDSADDKYRKPF